MTLSDLPPVRSNSPFSHYDIPSIDYLRHPPLPKTSQTLLNRKHLHYPVRNRPLVLDPLDMNDRQKVRNMSIGRGFSDGVAGGVSIGEIGQAGILVLGGLYEMCYLLTCFVYVDQVGTRGLICTDVCMELLVYGILYSFNGGV